MVGAGDPRPADEDLPGLSASRPQFPTFDVDDLHVQPADGQALLLLLFPALVFGQPRQGRLRNVAGHHRPRFGGAIGVDDLRPELRIALHHRQGRLGGPGDHAQVLEVRLLGQGTQVLQHGKEDRGSALVDRDLLGDHQVHQDVELLRRVHPRKHQLRPHHAGREEQAPAVGVVHGHGLQQHVPVRHVQGQRQHRRVQVDAAV